MKPITHLHPGLPKWLRMLFIAGIILFGTLETTLAEVLQDTVIPEYPQAAITAAQKRAAQARMQLSSTSSQTKSDSQPQADTATPLPPELQTSLLLSQINSATAEADKLRKEWTKNNKDKVLTLLKESKESTNKAILDSQTRIKTAQEKAEKSMQLAKTERQIAQEVIQRNTLRLQTAQNNAQNARQKMDAARQAVDTTWQNRTTSLEDMVQIDNTIAEAKATLALALQEIELARIEGEIEQKQAISQAEALEKQAQEAHKSMQTLLEQNRLENEALNAKLAKAQQLADKLFDQENTSGETIMAKTPSTPLASTK